LVVEQESLIVGYATFMKQFSTWDTDFYIYLDCLFLKENTRGNGLGGLIMEKIKEYAKNQIAVSFNGKHLILIKRQ